MLKNIEVNIFNGSTYDTLYPKTLGSLVDGKVSLATNADNATQLATARTIRTNLASTSTASFNGTANVTPGVIGTLSVSNGGTSSTTKANALINLGITYGTSDLTAGSSNLETGTFYFVYE